MTNEVMTSTATDLSEGQTVIRRAGHVVIAIQRASGPYDRYRVFVAYDETLREVDGLGFTATGWSRAAAIGNQLRAIFATGITAQQAIDVLPALRNLLDLAA